MKHNETKNHLYEKKKKKKKRELEKKTESETGGRGKEETKIPKKMREKL